MAAVEHRSTFCAGRKPGPPWFGLVWLLSRSRSTRPGDCITSQTRSPSCFDFFLLFFIRCPFSLTKSSSLSSQKLPFGPPSSLAHSDHRSASARSRATPPYRTVHKPCSVTAPITTSTAKMAEPSGDVSYPVVNGASKVCFLTVTLFFSWQQG